MLGRLAKLQWGLGNKTLKIMYEGALIPLLTYGAPVWKEAVAKQKDIRLLQRVQRMINIKIAKAYRTFFRGFLCNGRRSAHRAGNRGKGE